jgi:hypothetical protein
VGADRVGDHRVGEQAISNRFATRELEAIHAAAKLEKRATSRSPRVGRAADSQRHDAKTRDDPRIHAETIAGPARRVKPPAEPLHFGMEKQNGEPKLAVLLLLDRAS